MRPLQDFAIVKYCNLVTNLSPLNILTRFITFTRLNFSQKIINIWHLQSKKTQKIFLEAECLARLFTRQKF